MFWFKKKQCAICLATDIINVGKPVGYLCEKHMLDAYKTKFLAHQGRKLIIPPTPPDKYTSYQIETISLLKSYGLNQDDIAPLEKRFSDLLKSQCYVIESEYKPRDCLDIDFFETASLQQKTPDEVAALILSALPTYMKSNGIALPPDGDEDIIIYPLQS